MAKKVQLQTNGKEWRNGQYVDVEKRDIDPITSSSCIQIEGFRTLEEAVSDNKMLSQDLTYTKVMDKVGGDYHQNVLDGQYSKAILYGNTQVNLCEEDSSVALQIPTTFTSFNNGELQINNKENQVVAPLIKGVTMVNLAQTNSASITSENAMVIRNVKGNTVYTLSFTFTTKNTNSGVTIQCYDGNGTFIENTMHKTGLGDVVKFTFTTHANATKIHICNNAAYGGETIQLDDIMLIEGDQTALDIPFFKGMKSVELARPLTNLFNNDLEHYDANVTSTNSNGTVTVTASSNNSWANVHYNLTNLKANTNYLVMWDSIATNQTSTTSTDILICVAQASNNSNLGRMDNNDLNPTKRCIMFNTANVPLTDIVLRVHATLGNTETATTTVTGLRIFEYDDYLRSVDLQSIGWFSGTKNVAIEPIKTCSKNLYPYGDINFTPTQVQWHDAKGTNYMYGDIAQKSKCRFLLKKGTYKLSSDYNNRTNLGYMALVTDKEETMEDTTFTLDKDTYLTLRLQPVEANVPTTLTNIQIERGETVTDYVAHDSRYYEPNGQNAIVLRSLPDGVCDTFNLQTGEYTRRIGEIVLNGSEDWTLNKTLGDGSFNQFTVGGVQAKKIIQQEVVCDRLISKSQEAVNNVIWIYDGTTIVIQSSCASVDELKTWLQQNPLTVQYEFRESSTTIIPRTIKCNNNGAISTIDFKTYTNKESLALPKNPSYLTINSMTSIKPVVQPITYIDFKTRLKTNTDYSVIMDKDSANKTINLGGTSKTYSDKMLVRTPSVDLEQNLRISGSGSIQNIMVIEGDVLDKELPYFNGMCNVKMPIVRNSGKNLVDFDRDKTNWWVNNEGLSKGDDTGLYYSVMIKASGGNRYRIAMKNTDRSHYGFLDEDFNILVLNANNRDTVVAPKNTKYLIWYLSSTGLTSENNVQIELVENNNLIPTSYEPYRGNDICLVQGEIDLPKDMFEQGGFSANNGSGSTYETMKYDSTIRLRSKSLIRVKPNTTYYIKNNLPRVIFNLYQWNASVEFMQGTSKTNNASELLFTTTNDTHYIHFLFSKYGNENITVSEFDWSFFQLVELDSTVQLRSLPNGVKDELNLLTGEYIQRVGEVVLDGSSDEGWSFAGENTGGSKRLETQCISGLFVGVANSDEMPKMMCNQYDTFSFNIIYGGKKGIAFYSNTHIVVYDSKYTDVNSFLARLQQNPLVVQYQLAEPIISYPRIVSNTQEREVGVKLPNGICDTYNPSTGITVKRVGKVILDGSENWLIDVGYTPTANLIRLSIKQADKKLQYNNGDLVCDKLPVIQQGVVPCIYDRWNEYLYVDVTSSNIGVTFGTDDNATIISKFKTWLNANPLTVYYELANPIVTTDIVLPNGVHDEYNPLTGLYTKRVECIEFDGSEDEIWSPQVVAGNDTHCYASTAIDGTTLPQIKHMANHDEVYIMSDKFETVPRSNFSYDREQLYVWSARTVYLNILQSRLSTVDITGFRQYLSQNPIKLWYELQTPITYQLTPYFGLPMPYAYQGGHLIMDSAYEGQTLPPEITYQLTINRTGQITQNNIKLKEHTARLSNLEYMLIEATLDSIFDREMQNFELELMNVELFDLNE